MLTFRASDDLGPDALAEAESQRQELLTAISHLTLEQQEVIAYRFFGGLSPGEIAEIIGKRDGSVRALQFRAIESLRKLLLRAPAEDRVAGEQPSTLEAVASVLMPAEFASETIASDEVTEG
jgi:DNA-directed RNA polymerase specialized sigma24 family protein